MLPKIKAPCPENWDKMKIGLRGRFCDKCQFEVVDFTKMSREEVITYLYHHRQERVCGRLGTKQLDYHQDMLISIRSVLRKNSNSSMAFYLLTVGSLLLMQCEEPELKRADVQNPRVEVSLDQGDETLPEIPKEDFELIEVGMVLTGDVILEDYEGMDLSDDIEVLDPNTPRTIVDKMPEYPGGYSTFYEFVSKNMKFPKELKRMSIEGRVFVEFVVSPTGDVQDVKLLKGIHELADKEALRIFEKLPTWNPGMQNGFPVAVKMVMPIYFRLD